MKNSVPRPPKGLSSEARRLWTAVQSEYAVVDSGGLLVLNAAIEAFARMRQAQALLDAEGLTVLDRFGQQKAHPMTVVERDARGQMLAAIRQLGLDLEPLQDRVGRPAGGKKEVI